MKKIHSPRVEWTKDGQIIACPECLKELGLVGDFWYCQCGYLWYQPEVKHE